MEIKDYPKEPKQDKATLLINITRYITSLLFLFAGLLCLYIGETLAGVCSIMMGITSIPLIANAIKKKVGASGSLLLTILIAICLLRWVSQ